MERVPVPARSGEQVSQSPSLPVLPGDAAQATYDQVNEHPQLTVMSLRGEGGIRRIFWVIWGEIEQFYVLSRSVKVYSVICKACYLNVRQLYACIRVYWCCIADSVNIVMIQGI